MRIFLLFLVFVMLLSGCGLRPAESSSPVLTAEPDNKEENPFVFSFRFCNATGQDIYSVSFREATVSEEYTENLLSPGLVLRDGDWVNLSYDYSEAEKAFAEREVNGGGVSLSSEYRMLIVLQDGRHYELSAFPLGDMEECTVLLDDKVAYLSYCSLYSQQLIGTKEAERAIYEQWGRQARDISALVSQLPTAPVPTAAVETPVPTESPVPTETPQTSEASAGSDPNEGCLTGGLFY